MEKNVNEASNFKKKVIKGEILVVKINLEMINPIMIIEVEIVVEVVKEVEMEVKVVVVIAVIKKINIIN